LQLLESGDFGEAVRALRHPPQVRDLETDDLAENCVVVWLEFLACVEAHVSSASALRVSTVFARMVGEHFAQWVRLHHGSPSLWISSMAPATIPAP